jgi:hypothetical protein
MLSDPLDELRSVILEYEVRQAGAMVANASVELTEALRPVPVTVVLPAETPPPEVRLRERRIFSSGGLETLPQRLMTDVFVVTGIPAEDVMDVTVQYIGPPFDAIGALGMLVTLTYADPGGDADFAQGTAIFLDGREAQRWQVRLKDRAARRFTHQTTLMMANGQDRPGLPVTTDVPKVFLRFGN